MWVLLALTAAVCTALRDAASKHATRAVDPFIIAFGIAAVPAVSLGAIVLVAGPSPPEAGFGTALLVAGGINLLTTPLIVHALRRSDLSVVTPLRSLTPVFMLPVAGVVLAERPSPAGALGVATIVLGAYLLNVSRWQAGLLAPFRALFRDAGARMMLLVAFLYSISATFDKVGTQASSPLFWAAAVQGVVAVALAPMAAWRWRRGERSERSGRGKSDGGEDRGHSVAPTGALWAVVAAGLLTAIAAAAQMTALTLALAAFVIAVKRTSTLWGVLLGHSLFEEKGLAERALGALVMFAGFLLVTLG